MASEVAAKLEADLATAVKEGKVPHAIVYATNADGSFEYHHATGFQHYGVDDEPVHENPVLMLASMTKVLTVITSLKMVELGYTGLDDDVTPHLPELAAKQILTGFDENDKPILKDRKNPITLRQLLLHTSGLDYGFQGPIIQYRAQLSLSGPEFTNSGVVLTRYDHPLVHEPGTRWNYGPGLDFAGLLVKRLTSLDLEGFAQKHLWKPLGVGGEITFWPLRQDPGLGDRIPTLVVRAAGGEGEGPGGEPGKGMGGLVPYTEETINARAEEPFGGHGGYAAPRAFLEVLRSLLRDDERVLGRASVEELFRPQLSGGEREGLDFMRREFGFMVPGEQPTHIAADYGLGGMVYMEDDEGRRREGTLSWSGMVNPFWLIDRDADLALVFGTQVLPSGDAGCKEVTGIVERAVYKMAGKAER